MIDDELIEAIIRRDIGPGDSLVQEKLATEMQISRNSTLVREREGEGEDQGGEEGRKLELQEWTRRRLWRRSRSGLWR